MARLGRNRISAEVTKPQDGTAARGAKPGERYCAFCGDAANIHGSATERFGEAFCSEGHAEEFVKAVGAARVRAAAAATSTEVQPFGGAAEGALKQRDWKAYVGKALCWGAPLVALVFVLGGGGVVFGAAGALLPYLALLACPLGMYFAMRSMSSAGDRKNPGDREGEK